MQPLIAITAGEVVNHHYVWAPVVHGQYKTYVDAVVRAGGAPLLMPILQDAATLRRLYEQCDALLLSGGDDLHPRYYQARVSSPARRSRRASLQRDRQELLLLKWALEDDKPVFGICRGMQLINVGLGGSLHQDIGILADKHNHQASIQKQDINHLAHRLTIADGSRLAIILETTSISANALHHQAIHELGQGLVASAHAEDGVVEAIELPGKRFVIGVQSHPEALEAKIEPVWRKLFMAFIESAAQPRVRQS